MFVVNCHFQQISVYYVTIDDRSEMLLAETTSRDHTRFSRADRQR